MSALLPSLPTLPPHWAREAELSFVAPGLDLAGLQTRFDTQSEADDFLRMHSLDPAPFRATDSEIRSRFKVSRWRWIKLAIQDGVARDASQYFLLEPELHYPITSLRVFARRFGRPHSPLLESVLQPALEARDTLWGLALKPAAEQKRANVFCQLGREVLERVLTRMQDSHFLTNCNATKLLAWLDGLGGQPRLHLTVDPGDLTQLAVDVEDPTCLGILREWLESLNPHAPRYLKCRMSAEGPRWTAYFPWPSFPPPGSGPESLTRIREYYERTHEDYLACVGTTLQAALLEETPQASNLWLAREACIEDGMRILDAGCGVCGPALDIARAFNVRIDAVTLSEAQASTARERVRKAGLEERVRVHLGDYHSLAMPSGSFDAVVMFESASYSHDPQRLGSELFRLLRPGGHLYIKDFYLEARKLNPDELRAVHDYDYTYCTQTRTLPATLEALRQSGFAEVKARKLTDTSMEHFYGAMVQKERRTVSTAFLGLQQPTPRLTSFGFYHRRSWDQLPVYAGEIRALKL